MWATSWRSLLGFAGGRGNPPYQKLVCNRKYFSNHSYDLFTFCFKVVLRIEPDPAINFFWGSRCYRSSKNAHKVEGMPCFCMLTDPRLAGCCSTVDPQKLCSRWSSLSGDIRSFRGFKIGALTAKLGVPKVSNPTNRLICKWSEIRG